MSSTFFKFFIFPFRYTANIQSRCMIFPFSSSPQCVITGRKEPQCMQNGGEYEHYESYPADRFL